MHSRCAQQAFHGKVYQALDHYTLAVLQQNDSCTEVPATSVEGPCDYQLISYLSMLHPS